MGSSAWLSSALSSASCLAHWVLSLCPSFISSNMSSSLPPQVLTHVVLSTQRALPTALCIMGSFSSFRLELKCELLKEAFPDHNVHSRVSLYSLLLCTHLFSFLTLSTIYNYRLFHSVSFFLPLLLDSRLC